MDRKNLVTIRSRDKPWRDSNEFNTQLGDARPCGRVYCDSSDHKPHECTKVSDPSERRKIFLRKRLCFNCARDDHRATECKSRKTCLFCKRRHHTSISDRGNADNSMTATQIGDGPVVYPAVVVEVAGIKGTTLPIVRLLTLKRRPKSNYLRKYLKPIVSYLDGRLGSCLSSWHWAKHFLKWRER